MKVGNDKSHAKLIKYGPCLFHRHASLLLLSFWRRCVFSAGLDEPRTGFRRCVASSANPNRLKHDATRALEHPSPKSGK